MGKGNREPGFEHKEVREMRSAEQVLQIIRDRGNRGLQLEENVYRQLFNPLLYLLAYSRIYKTNGAFTQATPPEPPDPTSYRTPHPPVDTTTSDPSRRTPPPHT